MRPVAELHDDLAAVIGTSCDAALLLRALTHRSYSYENGEVPHNERLEFLGDSVLGLVVTNALYGDHPDLPEGQLAKLRAAVVNSHALAEAARGIDLGSFVLLGKGEDRTGGRDKDSILADTMEAVIGCVYVSVGLEQATVLVHHLLDPIMKRSINLGAALDWKTSLQEAAAAAGLGDVEYQSEASGPDHAREFTAVAIVGGEVRGRGEAGSKKRAEQQAAATAWESIAAAHPADAGAS